MLHSNKFYRTFFFFRKLFPQLNTSFKPRFIPSSNFITFPPKSFHCVFEEQAIKCVMMMIFICNTLLTAFVLKTHKQAVFQCFCVNSTQRHSAYSIVAHDQIIPERPHTYICNVKHKNNNQWRNDHVLKSLMMNVNNFTFKAEKQSTIRDKYLICTTLFWHIFHFSIAWHF